ncbi:hypothetical protein [Demequina soli]|uniref:hypothetical protein n=1 Tax=Demequina soli TaxID=1638987 RepID=UPI000782A1F7|nr:hypothetical protein [Demequina soli]
MRMNQGIKVAVVAASAGLLLAACSTDSDTDASTSPAASDTVATLNVSQIVEDIRTATGCESWAGGRVAGEGVLASYEYSCDATGEGTDVSTFRVYTSGDALDSDLVTIEADDTTSGIVKTDSYIFATPDADQLAAVSALGGEVVRDIQK